MHVTSRLLRINNRPLSRSISTSPRYLSPPTQSRQPPPPPDTESAALKNNEPATYLGTTKRLPEFNLVDKVVCVSGAGRGLGLVQAEALLEAGATGTIWICDLHTEYLANSWFYKVYALDRLETPSPDFGRIAERAKNELGTSLSYRRIDVRDVESLNSIVEDIAKKEGRMDGLIAAAGIQQETPALEYTAKDVDLMMSVNVTGVFMTAQAVAKQMVKFGNGGSIVLIASMSGTIANRGLICPAYNASKSAVLQLARNLASEWGEHNIRVNTISPGYIVTAMVEELFKKFPERRTEWPKQNMLNRLSLPEEYRGAAVFLVSDASSFMTDLWQAPIFAWMEDMPHGKEVI
ncbi:putative sorbitol utilization SOU2 protein [Rutstroemia sp. NJR-2017a BVV2]|nr:putative sorbitol utilization SOU2 protein [Rutstroemia sp. NJR-2017a BVV2]